MEIELQCLGVILGASLALYIYDNYVRYMRVPDNYIIIEYTVQYEYQMFNQNKRIVINTSDAQNEYEVIMKSPYRYIREKYLKGSVDNINITSVRLGRTNEKLNIAMHKIAIHMGLDISKCKNNKQLIKTIETHIKYAPSLEVNEGYIAAKNDFTKRSE